MSKLANVCMSKIMQMPIEVGVRRYATYANCRTLSGKKTFFKQSFMICVTFGQ